MAFPFEISSFTNHDLMIEIHDIFRKSKPVDYVAIALWGDSYNNFKCNFKNIINP